MSDLPDYIPEITSTEVEKVFDNLPVTLNLGDYDNTIIGWSTAYRKTDDGTTTIVMTISGEDSEKLGDLVRLFKLYAIGFAAIARRPM